MSWLEQDPSQNFAWIFTSSFALASARTHDFAYRKWGHRCMFTPDETTGGVLGSITGWGPEKSEKIAAGDFIILRNLGFFETSRYQVTAVRYFDNPADMFSGKVIFAPRQAIMREQRA